MSRSELIHRICDLDQRAQLSVLVTFGDAELQYHLQVLMQQREVAPAPAAKVSAEPSPLTDSAPRRQAV